MPTFWISILSPCDKSSPKCRWTHLQSLRGLAHRHFPAAAADAEFLKALRQRERFSAELLPSRPCRRDPLGLPLTDGLPLGLGKVGHHLQDQIPIERLFDTITFCTLQGALLIDSGCIVYAYERERLLRRSRAPFLSVFIQFFAIGQCDNNCSQQFKIQSTLLSKFQIFFESIWKDNSRVLSFFVPSGREKVFHKSYCRLIVRLQVFN